MEKVKICWAVTNVEIYNTKWSMRILFDNLRNRQDVDFTVIEYGVPKSSLLWKFLDCFLKIIYTWRTPQDIILRGLYKKKLEQLLDSTDVDYVFFPAVFCCVSNKLIKRNKWKVCVYTDALMTDLDKYRNYKPLKFIASRYVKENVCRDIQKTDILFCQNEWSSKRFCEVCGISPSKVYNVHFGVNLNLFDGEKDYSKHRLLIVLRKGNEYHKGCKLLVEAMPIIRERINDVTLDIVGTDYGDGGEGITCHYNKPRSVTVDLFKQATLYVMPSIREPNGVTFLEGLANKTPIVGLDRYAFPEFSGYGKWGFICKKPTPQALADIVCDALSDHVRLHDMGLRGQDYVRKCFQWNVVADNMVEIMKTKLSE